MNSIIQSKVDKFFRKYSARQVADSSIIISPDKSPDGIYKLDSGRVIQYDISDEGVKIMINVFKPPAYFPMSWAINRQYDHYFFEAHGDCIIRKAPADETLEFIKNNPDVLLDLTSRLYRGMSGFQRRIFYMASSDAHKRLTFELIITAKRFGKELVDGVYAIPLTETDLAASTGLSRETVNREIAKLKLAGLIKVKNRKLYLSSIEEMEVHLEG